MSHKTLAISQAPISKKPIYAHLTNGRCPKPGARHVQNNVDMQFFSAKTTAMPPTAFFRIETVNILNLEPNQDGGRVRAADTGAQTAGGRCLARRRLGRMRRTRPQEFKKKNNDKASVRSRLEIRRPAVYPVSKIDKIVQKAVDRFEFRLSLYTERGQEQK